VSNVESEVEAQRRYYAETAADYDTMHIDEGDEHFFALSWLSALIGHLGYQSLLDIGSGTGRAIIDLKERHSIRCVGIEPVEALRAQGHAKGLSADELRDGDVLKLDFPDNSFDVVSAFAVLHHVKDHKAAVREMCRVAKRAVFISDANNFGQGSLPKRALKQLINAFGLWGAYDWLATRGKGYHWSKGDGVFYSYSLFNDVPILKEKFPTLNMMNTLPTSSGNLYRSAPHLAVLATKQV
jgi:ubiquinone/menaquinone biosynthesis C-methylase UbiE